MTDIKKLLELRRKQRNKRPRFLRQGYGIYKRIKEQWRKPKGRHSKMKHQMAGHPRKVKPGFRTNRLVRNLDMSGLIPVVINSFGHISLLNKDVHGAIIGGNVGNRKRILLLAELKKHGIKVLNLKEGHDKKILAGIEAKKKLRDEKFAKKTDKKSKKEIKAKKEEKELTQEEKEAQEKKEKDKILTREQK